MIDPAPESEGKEIPVVFDTNEKTIVVTEEVNSTAGLSAGLQFVGMAQDEAEMLITVQDDDSGEHACSIFISEEFWEAIADKAWPIAKTAQSCAEQAEAERDAWRRVGLPCLEEVEAIRALLGVADGSVVTAVDIASRDLAVARAAVERLRHGLTCLFRGYVSSPAEGAITELVNVPMTKQALELASALLDGADAKGERR